MVSTAFVMMGLGTYRFALATAAYDEFSRTTEHRWASLDRAGRSPALQYLGPGSDTIQLSGVIRPSFAGGLDQIEAMRAEAATGTPRMLVDGLGWIWGRWAIRSIEDRQRIFFGDGVPREMAFSLSLEFYGEDA